MADFLQHAPPDDREGVSGAVSAQFPLARADKGENRFLSPVSFNRACVRPMPSVLDGGEKHRKEPIGYDHHKNRLHD